ncbi:MAG: hypothetical protein JNK85_02465 [Verrucomicrobiales bacterium]|nr:hypothetical protein [Verrucomicrobiales bacterium]
MRDTRWRWLGLRSLGRVLVLIGVAGISLGAWAADDARKLKEELEKVRRENELLRQENERLKGSVTSPSASPAPVVPPAPSASPTPTVGTSGAGARTVVIPAPVADGTRVAVAELLADYQTSALAGDAKYKGRRLQIEGQVDSFKKGFIGLSWTVQLKAADRLGAVRCKTSFPGISDFRPSPNGRLLEGRRPFKPWHVLLQQDQTVVLEGICDGIDDSVVVMEDCKPVS